MVNEPPSSASWIRVSDGVIERIIGFSVSTLNVPPTLDPPTSTCSLPAGESIAS